MGDMSVYSINGNGGINPFEYTVGQYGITSIVQGRRSPEPYCEVVYYEVYKQGKIFATVYDRAVCEVLHSNPLDNVEF